MYKDTKKKDKRVKILTITSLIIIFVLLLLVCIYEVFIKKAEYVDIWGEEKGNIEVEYIEEELHPENNTGSQGITFSYNKEGPDAEDERKYRHSDYYGGSDLYISTPSSYSKYDIYKLQLPTPSNTKKEIPNYHTGKIYYHDLNEE
ncbi:MAG: hypothetical protein IJ593_12645 [Lachnospiraceae bacterium]|nr:hypothetical protein [Lachnospiraceae bacterium]MBR1455471.1 hypothetical protein [Lachnospiraceae bacterium]